MAEENKKPEFFSRAKELLSTVSSFKQEVYSNSFELFDNLKKISIHIADDLSEYMSHVDKRVEIEYKDVNKNEFYLKFGGDVLVFSLHSNVFSFDTDHPMYNSSYIQEDRRRGYFTMIEVFNFLSDSVKFERLNDVGELLARIFVNIEGHYFVEGLGSIGSMYTDLPNQKVSRETVEDFIQSLMVASIDFDLWVPPFQQVRFIPLQSLIIQNGNSPRNTSKRLGFELTQSEVLNK